VDGLLRCLRKAPFPSRLGEYWLVVQEGLAHGEIDEGVFALFDQFDGSGGKVPLSVQRLEHLEMWMLLGDPALHLPIVPVDIALEAGTNATPGKPIKVSGTLPARLLGATVQVTLERPTGSMPAGFQKLADAAPENRVERERVAAENYNRANQVVLAKAEIKVIGNRFECVIEALSQLPWPQVVVRAYAATERDAALGVLTLPVGQ